MRASAMTPEVQVEDVVALAREETRHASGREVPSVAILPITVKQEDSAPGLLRFASRVGCTLADHAQADGTVRDDELFYEAADVVAVDGLLDDLAGDDHTPGSVAEPARHRPSSGNGAISGCLAEKCATCHMCLPHAAHFGTMAHVYWHTQLPSAVPAPSMSRQGRRRRGVGGP